MAHNLSLSEAECINKSLFSTNRKRPEGVDIEVKVEVVKLRAVELETAIQL